MFSPVVQSLTDSAVFIAERLTMLNEATIGDHVLYAKVGYIKCAHILLV
jgi:hypothetical protein